MLTDKATREFIDDVAVERALRAIYGDLPLDVHLRRAERAEVVRRIRAGPKGYQARAERALRQAS